MTTEEIFDLPRREPSRTWDVEVQPHQVKAAIWSLERSHCRIVTPIQDGRAGTKRITYIMPEQAPKE